MSEIIAKPMLVQVGLTQSKDGLNFVSRSGARLCFGEECIITAPRKERIEFMGTKFNFQALITDYDGIRTLYPIAGKEVEGFFEWTHVLIEFRTTEESLYLSMNYEWKSELFQSEKY